MLAVINHRLVAGMVVVVVTACGADTTGSSPGSAPPSGSTATTTAPTTTTVAHADAATAELAAKATVTLADLGAGWTSHAAERESEPITDGDCAQGSPVADLPLDARKTGAQFKVRDGRWFVYTNAAVFPDEAAAVKWVEVRKSPGYIECRRVEIEKGQQAADPRFSVATAQTTGEGLGVDGFEAYVLYQLKADVGSGPQDSNANFARHTYRVGRTVISLSIDIASEHSDPADLADRVSDDVTKALTAVYQRIQSS